MYSVEKSDIFEKWFLKLEDRLLKRKVSACIANIRAGNLGDHHSVGDGVSEIRLHFGAGYRIYYTIRKQKIVFLLFCGTKSQQDSDIKRAKEIAKEVNI